MSYRTTRAFQRKSAIMPWQPIRSPKKDPNQQGWQGSKDPVEQKVEALLREHNEPFYRNHESRLDFYLPRLNLFIECKQFYTPRIADQLSRVSSRDVIVFQGVEALEKFLMIVKKE